MSQTAMQKGQGPEFVFEAPAEEPSDALCVQTQDGVVTLILEGELGLEDLRRVGQELFRVASRGQHKVVIDLSQVSHLDYRGLRPLATRAELLRRAGGDVRVCGVNGYLFHIFRAAGAHDAFMYFADPENARLSFSDPG